MNTFYHGDCKFVMKRDISPESIDLIYLDPPFFTGKIQKGKWQPGAMEISFEDSKGYWGKHQKEMHQNAPAWMNSLPRSDAFKAYLWYMMERLQTCHRVLKPTGSIYLHCDWHASHYLKMVMDAVFGNDNFRNEIIWSYHWGIHTKKQWNRKHDSIIFYSKSSKWHFDAEPVREPYSEGSIMTQDPKWNKSYNPNGRLPEDVWYIPTINAAAKERMGYPTQKPEALLKRIIEASSNENEVVLDPFCGCGTTIAVAQTLNRRWIGIDISKDAYDVSHKREKQLSLGEYKESQYISRDLDEVMSMDGREFEKWVNQYYGATKPKDDKEVDGITPEGTPIQVKAWKDKKVDSPDIHKFSNGIKYHPDLQINKPNTAYYVSQSGFTDRSRALVHEIGTKEDIDIKLIEPEDLINNDDK